MDISLPEPITKWVAIIFKSQKLNSSQRKWLYDIIGFRASLGSLSDALPMMIEQASSRGKKGKKKADILTRIYNRSERSGMSFSDTIHDMVPEDEYHLIASAEGVSDLSKGLELAELRLKEKEQQSAGIQSVFIGIGVRFFMLVSIVYFLGQSLFPPLLKISKVEKWPPLAQNMYHISQTVHIWLPIILIIVAVIVGVIFWSINNWKHSPSRVVVSNYLPPWKTHKDITCMTLMSAFSAMTSTFSEKEVLRKLTNSSHSPWAKQCLAMMQDRIRRGVGNPFMNNPIVPDELNDVLVSLGEGDKKVFYIKSIERLKAKIEKDMANIEKTVNIVGTLLLYNMMGAMVLSYFLVSTTAI